LYVAAPHTVQTETGCGLWSAMLLPYSIPAGHSLVSGNLIGSGLHGGASAFRSQSHSVGLFLIAQT